MLPIEADASIGLVQLSRTPAAGGPSYSSIAASCRGVLEPARGERREVHATIRPEALAGARPRREAGHRASRRSQAGWATGFTSFEYKFGLATCTTGCASGAPPAWAPWTGSGAAGSTLAPPPAPQWRRHGPQRGTLAIADGRAGSSGSCLCGRQNRPSGRASVMAEIAAGVQDGRARRGARPYGSAEEEGGPVAGLAALRLDEANPCERGRHLVASPTSSPLAMTSSGTADTLQPPAQAAAMAAAHWRPPSESADLLGPQVKAAHVNSTPLTRRVRPVALDRDRIVVERDHRRAPELGGGDRQHPRAAPEVEQRPSDGVSAEHQLQAQPGGRVGAGPERLPGIDHHVERRRRAGRLPRRTHASAGPRRTSGR